MGLLRIAQHKSNLVMDDQLFWFAFFLIGMGIYAWAVWKD